MASSGLLSKLAWLPQACQASQCAKPSSTEHTAQVHTAARNDLPAGYDLWHLSHPSSATSQVTLTHCPCKAAGHCPLSWLPLPEHAMMHSSHLLPLAAHCALVPCTLTAADDPAASTPRRRHHLPAPFAVPPQQPAASESPKPFQLPRRHCRVLQHHPQRMSPNPPAGDSCVPQKASQNPLFK